MSKATIEFTPLSVFPLTLPANPSVDAGVRLLSHAHRSGDKTLVLYHPPGQEWEGDGGSNTQAAHTYWEVSVFPSHSIAFLTVRGRAGGSHFEGQNLRQDAEAMVWRCAYSRSTAAL